MDFYNQIVTCCFSISRLLFNIQNIKTKSYIFLLIKDTFYIVIGIVFWDILASI